MVIERIEQTIRERELATSETPVVLMVSGGSDSTALAYLASDLHMRGTIGSLGIMHVNHKLRGQAAEDDAVFVEQLAQALKVPFYLFDIDVASKAASANDNIEAVGRQERYAAAHEALEKLCRQTGIPTSSGRIFTAHTQNDRVENFYMRSIVGTGPGGFRSMRYLNGSIARPLLDVSREQLRDYLARRKLDAAVDAQVVLVCDTTGALWREDATNAHTDRFRTYVRHEIVPKARARNPRLEETLCRSMNLIADEDDMLERMAADIMATQVRWTLCEQGTTMYQAGCLLAPAFGGQPIPLQRRVVVAVLKAILGEDERIEAASIQAVIDGFADGVPIAGYTGNIQGNLALSANKRGLLIEPMQEYRMRRKGK